MMIIDILFSSYIIDDDFFDPSEGNVKYYIILIIVGLILFNKYYDFTKIKEFGPEVLTLRNPSDDAYELVENRGLKLKCSKNLITSLGDVSYIAIRQDCHNFEIGCTINTENLLRGASAA